MTVHRLILPALAAALALPTVAPAQQSSPQGQQQQAQQQQQPRISADAHHLIGKKAIGDKGKELGEIKDVLVGQDGKVQALVIDHDRKTRAVPWDQVTLQGDQVSLRMTYQQLSQLPEYRTGKD